MSSWDHVLIGALKSQTLTLFQRIVYGGPVDLFRGLPRDPTAILTVGWLWAKHCISSVTPYLHRCSSGPSVNGNSHAVPSDQGAAMPRATPGNRTRMAESRGKELTPRPECSPVTLTLFQATTRERRSRCHVQHEGIEPGWPNVEARNLSLEQNASHKNHRALSSFLCVRARKITDLSDHFSSQQGKRLSAPLVCPKGLPSAAIRRH